MNKKNYSNFNNDYLLNIDDNEKIRFVNNESNEKKRYIDNSDSRNKNYLNHNSNRNSSVDVDSFLRYPPNYYQNKTSIELNKKLDHDKYDVIYSNKASNIKLPNELQRKKIKIKKNIFKL